MGNLTPMQKQVIRKDGKMSLGLRLIALFARKKDAIDTRFDLRLQAMGSPLPISHRKTQSPFKNQPERQAA